MNYSLKDIAAICGGELTGADCRVDAVMTDSRHSYGSDEHPLFVAIAGQNHDGHRYIDDMYRRGVRGFMVERTVDTTAYSGAGFVRVSKSLHALQALAADYRSGFGGVMAAVTGSSGKTTVKEWIAQLAPDGMPVFRSPRSYNSQLGVPLSILMMRGDERLAVIESGISRPGEMARLAAVVRPDVGIFTTLGDEHQENFDSPAHKLNEKAKLFATCHTVIYVGGDAPRNENTSGKLIVEDLRRALQTAASNTQLIDAHRYMDAIAERFADRPSREDAALAIAFYESQGIPASETISRLDRIHPVAMRLDISEGVGGSLIVSDRSNTDINSLAIALDHLAGVAVGRPRMLIMSDILYSSMSDSELYERVASMVAGAGVEYLVGIGERIKAHGDMFDCRRDFYADADDFLNDLTQDKIAGRAILVKGNRSAGFPKIMHQLERRSHTTVLEIDLDAMRHNLNWFRGRLPAGTRLMAMVKASSYGNGNYEVAAMLQNQGVDYLAVAFADEGVRLREQGITMPIVVLNADSDSFDLMVANRLEPEIYSFASLDAFIRAVEESAGSGYPIHIKLDTGMHRLGFVESDLPLLIERLRREQPAIVVRSVFSHLAASDDPAEDDFTRGQIAAFETMSEAIMDALPNKPLRHIANSAAIERFPEAAFDMCRLGIGLYGIGSTDRGELRPVSRLTTRIVQIKELDPAQTVGYGRAGKLHRATRIATIPVGYADGLDRRLGEGRWSVRVGGSQAPTVGRICMDSCMVNVTGLDVGEGGEVVVFGHEAGNSVEDMARILNTIPYEIMTSISDRVKRIYIKE